MKGQEDVPSTVSVQVVCRVRPFQPREFFLSAGEQIRSIVTMTDTTTSFLDPKDDFREKECFHFDWNIWSIPRQQQAHVCPVSSQKDVFQRVGLRALGHLFDGYNSCLLAYGQTGSGKTYTILGNESEKGLIPLFCDELFAKIRASSRDGCNCHVEATLLEIYNERVKDLLWELGDKQRQQSEKWDGENLRVRNAPGQGPYVVGLTTVVVESAADCEVLISIGMQNRVVAATKMNDQSSRSHALFRLTLVQEMSKTGSGPNPERSASSVFADLAGSERVKKSGAQGLRMKEAAAINQSLTTLRSVIDALVDHRSVIPFRESTLTLLLSECLGGNSITTMIACVSPHADNAEETLNTLRYAHRAQGIVCRPKIGETDVSRRIGRLKEELLETQRMIDEGSDSHKLLIVRAENERRKDELEQSSRVTRDEVRNLMRDLSLERQRRYVSSYARAFHLVVLQVSLSAATKRQQALKEHILQATSALAEPQQLLDSSERSLRKAKATHDSEYLALTRTSKELEQVACSCEELEAANRNLTEIDEQLRHIRAQHLAKLKYDHVRLALLLGDRRHTTRVRLEETTEKFAEELRAYAEQIDEKTHNNERKRLLRMREVEMRIEQKRTLTDEAETERAAMCRSADQKRHKLAEAAIFFEHENRAIDDERIVRLQQIEREAERRFATERELLQEKCTKIYQTMEGQHLDALVKLRTDRRALDTENLTALKEIVRAGQKQVASCANSGKVALAQAVTVWRKELESHCVWEMDSADCAAMWQQLQERVNPHVMTILKPVRAADAQQLWSAIHRGDNTQLSRRSNRVTTQISEMERAHSARSASEKLLFQPQSLESKTSHSRTSTALRATERQSSCSLERVKTADVPRPRAVGSGSLTFAIGSRQRSK